MRDASRLPRFVIFFAFQSLLLGQLLSAKDSKPSNAANLLKQGSENLKLKRYSEALQDLNAAIEADPELSEAYWHRASAFRQLCRFEESEENYKKCLQLKAGTSAVEKELSQLLQAKSAMETASNLFDYGDFAKALDYIEKVVLVFSPNCLKAKYLKVRLLIVLKDYSSAITESGYILKEDENNLEALLLRGRAYYYLADHDVAMRFGHLAPIPGVALYPLHFCMHVPERFACLTFTISTYNFMGCTCAKSAWEMFEMCIIWSSLCRSCYKVQSSLVVRWGLYTYLE